MRAPAATIGHPAHGYGLAGVLTAERPLTNDERLARFREAEAATRRLKFFRAHRFSPPEIAYFNDMWPGFDPGPEYD